MLKLFYLPPVEPGVYFHALRHQVEDEKDNASREENKMKHGVLVVDNKSERMDIRFGIEEYNGGLHCSECMDVLIDNKWVPTRIKMGDDWYL